MTRNPNASLSPEELASLRLVWTDARQAIPSKHRELLVSMRLVKLWAGVLMVTDEGHQRLRDERVQSSGRQQPSSPSNDA